MGGDGFACFGVLTNKTREGEQFDARFEVDVRGVHCGEQRRGSGLGVFALDDLGLPLGQRVHGLIAGDNLCVNGLFDDVRAVPPHTGGDHRNAVGTHADRGRTRFGCVPQFVGFFEGQFVRSEAVGNRDISLFSLCIGDFEVGAELPASNDDSVIERERICFPCVDVRLPVNARVDEPGVIA